MPTIKEHESTLRTIIKRYSDDTIYTEQFLYNLMKQARMLLLRQTVKKHEPIASTTKQTICITVVDSNFHDCSCVPDDSCQVKKSQCQIPPLITTRLHDLIEISDMSGRVIPFVPSLKLKAKAYSKLNKPYFTIYNKYIYLFNSEFKVIRATGIFEDPEDLANCGCGEQTDCASITDEFPMDSHLIFRMYEICIKLIGLGFDVSDDDINDARAESE